MAEEVQEYEDDITGCIANLSGALSTLQEIDSAMLSKQDQKKLTKMKDQIFKALAEYCDCLGSEEED